MAAMGIRTFRTETVLLMVSIAVLSAFPVLQGASLSCHPCQSVRCPAHSKCGSVPPCRPICTCEPGYRAINNQCVNATMTSPTEPTPAPVQTSGSGTSVSNKCASKLTRVYGRPATCAGSTSASAVNCLPGHNAARAAVGVPPLTWSTAAASAAQSWANALASSGRCLRLLHGGTDGFGQNLYGYSAASTCQMAVRAWADEAELYSYGLFNPPASSGCRTGDWESCGHYTQLVWADTTKVGCGVARCADGGSVWACDYDPPGNVVGEYPY